MTGLPTSGPRIEPIPRPAWSEAMMEALTAMRPPTPRHAVPPPGGRPDKPKALGVLGTFAHHPDLAQVWLGFNGHVLYGTTLTLRQREILVLRVSVVLRSTYTWAQHVIQKDEADLTDEDIARIAFGPDAPFLEPLERAMVRSVDELVSDGGVGEQTWAVLAEHLDPPQLLDLLFTVGCYTTLCWLYQTFQLELESDLPQGSAG